MQCSACTAQCVHGAKPRGGHIYMCVYTWGLSSALAMSLTPSHKKNFSILKEYCGSTVPPGVNSNLKTHLVYV